MKEVSNGKMAWIVDESDNVATVLSEGVTEGISVSCRIEDRSMEVKALEKIPYGHKIAIKPIKAAETIRKYGLSIGRSLMAIESGQHVHVHNIEPMRGRGDLSIKNKIQNNKGDDIS
jgi:altronate dehydratase small subunit